MNPARNPSGQSAAIDSATTSIAFEPPDQPEVARLIDALDAYQKPLYPPESHHGIDMAALRQPNVLFAVVRDAQKRAVGCGAVVVGEEHGELKRMFVSPECRGHGLGNQLLCFLEAAAIDSGCSSIILETGIHQLAAITLYERAGYVRRAPFGNYIEDPLSVFMQKQIVRRDDAISR
ncbi:MAG: GNAT family N-acetyltransferase [Betaproteobacteria bacterium]